MQNRTPGRESFFPRLSSWKLINFRETHDRAHIASITNSFRTEVSNASRVTGAIFPKINMRRGTMMLARTAHNDNLSSVSLLKIA